MSQTEPRLQDQDAVLKDKKHSFTLNRREALGNPGNSLKSGIILGYFVSHTFPLIFEKNVFLSLSTHFRNLYVKDIKWDENLKLKE